MTARVVLKELPQSFRRYPCPGSNSALEGSVEVNLGKWLVNGKEEAVHLRICGENLQQLVQEIAEANGRTKRFAYGAFDVFVVAATISE